MRWYEAEIARLKKALEVAHTYAESYRGYPTSYSGRVEEFTKSVLSGAEPAAWPSPILDKSRED